MNLQPRPGSPSTSNGSHDDKQHALRLVFFSESIVSDWQNPVATTLRAVLRSLIADGYDVVHLEQRRNRPTVELLRARGSTALRAFNEQYADLPYRTYDLPAGVERTVWFVREVATTDAVVIVDGTPEDVVKIASQLDTPRLTRVHWSSDLHAETSWAEVNVTPDTSVGPAVERRAESSPVERSGLLLVAYDDQVLADTAREALSDLNPRCLTLGRVTGDQWQAMSEIEVTEAYRQARLAVVVDTNSDPFASARTWLPVGNNCPAIAVTSETTIGDLHERVTAALAGESPAPELPSDLDATVIARRLVEQVRIAQRRRHSHHG